MKSVTMPARSATWISLIVLSIISGCSQKQEPMLKDAFKDDFYVGAALTGNQVRQKDPILLALVKDQFNTITSENALKWDTVHPELNRYSFEKADSFVALGMRNHMFIIGHCLIWHAQVPKWVFEDKSGNPVSRDTLLKRMHDHILTVVTRYKGKVGGWDVVNEALDENGELRHSRWLDIIGEDYIRKAFEFAHEADPDAELYYNDYNIEHPAKREGTLIKIIKSLQDKGIRVDGVGIQAHWHLDIPSFQVVDSSISKFVAAGLKVMFTEMDINVLPRPENLSTADVSDSFKLTKDSNPYPVSLPDSIEQQLADRYAGFFKIFKKYRKSVSRVTFWGITDAQSWLNNWPIAGRTNYPLLYDRNLKPKPAFYAILKVAGSGK